MSESAPRTARDRVRAELTSEIKAVARRHLAENGSAALSLRAVSRELGMVSSAVYRYFPSRDDLLTALIIDAYNAVGDAVDEAEVGARRSHPMGRWLAAARAMRTWARANPQEYALIFGSPIPGYEAPLDTIDPAARVPLVLLRLVAETASERSADADDAAAGTGADDGATPLPRTVHFDLSRLRAEVAPAVSDRQMARAVMAWTQLVGSISFELFGHLHNVITDYDAYFDFQMREIGRGLGFPARR